MNAPSLILKTFKDAVAQTVSGHKLVPIWPDDPVAHFVNQELGVGVRYSQQFEIIDCVIAAKNCSFITTPYRNVASTEVCLAPQHWSIGEKRHNLESPFRN